MIIKDKISSDIKDAMRAKDSKKLQTLRSITAAVKQIEVDERVDVDDERMLIILDKLVKQRKESISQFEAAGRDDLANIEKIELEIIERYLPAPLDAETINKLIDQAITDTGAEKMSDMGKVMAILKPQLQGRADIGKVSGIIKFRLS
jgi:uncharacterized protein YqeY